MQLEERKKPKQQRSISRVNQILDTAALILEQDGIEKLTTNYLAKTSGISVGSIYQYFPNKDAIIVKLIERQQKRKTDFLRKQVFELKHTNLERMVEGLISALFSFQKKNPRLEQILIQKQYVLGVNYFEKNLDRVWRIPDHFGKNLDRFLANP